MDAIELKDIEFAYIKPLFHDLSLTIETGKWTAIIGKSGSGKSTLLKIIVGLVAPTKGSVKILNEILTNETKKKIRNEISFVFENPDYQFIENTVYDDIAFSLENLHVPKEEIKLRVDEVLKLLQIADLKDMAPTELSGGEKQLVALATALVKKPKILILDEALPMIDNARKEKIFKLLADLKRKEKLTIIQVTRDIEETLNADTLVLLDNGAITKDKPLNLYKDEKTLKDVGLPFMAELSLKLKYYGLIDKIILKMDKMVNALWK